MRLCFVLFVVVAVAASADTGEKLKSRRRREACDENELLCNDGECIQQEWLCDTELDCKNGEDENDCPLDCSHKNQFHCSNGDCITIEYRCDGDNDCSDESDERQCETWNCTTGEVKCPATFRCIEAAWMCDTEDDCNDNWDEQQQNCAQYTTPVPGR